MSIASSRTTKGQQLLFFLMATPVSGRDARIADSAANMWAVYKDTAYILALLMVLMICGLHVTAYRLLFQAFMRPNSSGGVNMPNAFVLFRMPVPAFLRTVIRMIAVRGCRRYQCVAGTVSM